MSFKKINWWDHFTNLIVVIVGISIAFYLEGYKESKASKKNEQLYLESLISDLESDIAALDTLRQLNKMINTAIASLSDATIGKGYTDLTKLRNDIMVIQYNPPFVPQRTVYESIKSSGQINSITDFELRTSIIELYEQFYRGTNQYDDALSEHVRDFIKPFCIQNMKFTSATTVDDAFLKDVAFRNMIFAYRYLFSAKHEFYGQVQDQVMEVKEKLKSGFEEL